MILLVWGGSEGWRVCRGGGSGETLLLVTSVKLGRRERERGEEEGDERERTICPYTNKNIPFLLSTLSSNSQNEI